MIRYVALHPTDAHPGKLCNYNVFLRRASLGTAFEGGRWSASAQTAAPKDRRLAPSPTGVTDGRNEIRLGE